MESTHTENAMPIRHQKTPGIFTCRICIEPAENRFRNGDGGCSHPFCSDCVVKYIRAKLDNDNAARISCPDPDCDRTLDPRACESLVGASLFVRWCDVLCEESTAGLPRCYCPYRWCSALIVNECGGTARESRCPECRGLFCFECKSAWHAGFGCEEKGEIRDENELAFGRLAVAMKWMRCPGCRHFVSRVDGCPTVKCRCGISFCHECGKQLVNRSWCRCNSVGRCSEYCFRICMFFPILILVSILVPWSLMHHRGKH